MHQKCFIIYYKLIWYCICTSIFFFLRGEGNTLYDVLPPPRWMATSLYSHSLISPLKEEQRESKLLHMWIWGNSDKPPVLVFSYRDCRYRQKEMSLFCFSTTKVKSEEKGISVLHSPSRQHWHKPLQLVSHKVLVISISQTVFQLEYNIAWTTPSIVRQG